VRLLVSMGVRDRAGGPLRAELAVLDPDRGVLETRRVVVRERAGPTAHQELTCACLDRDGLVVQPAHTELLWIDPTSLGVVRRASHPLFHGVHSAAVRPADGAIAVTCAGTESVLVLSPAGELLAHHFLRPQPFAAAYPGIDDFRTVDHDGFKPHSHHPNHAEWWGDELWVTCFETQDCTAIPTGRRIPLTGGIPHDGRLRDGLFWFTQVTGARGGGGPRFVAARGGAGGGGCRRGQAPARLVPWRRGGGGPAVRGVLDAALDPPPRGPADPAVRGGRREVAPRG
jgi:hypothetical protein